ncbi:MAG: serine/threonine protein kinase, partial [Chloroflexi bacterium]|nr:serine/threonine protein kinase [Chloroflexota bacterium]
MSDETIPLERDTYTHLSGLKRSALLIVAVSLSLLTVFVYIRAIPVGFRSLAGEFSPRFDAVLAAVGLRVGFVTGALVVLEALTFAIFVVTGLVLIARRSDDLVSLLTGTMLVVFGAATTITFNYVFVISGFYSVLHTLLTTGGYALFVWYLYTLPHGHFEPRWSRFVLALWVLYTFAGLIAGSALYDSGFLTFAGFTFQAAVYGLGFFGLTYRINNTLTPLQVQQVKWVGMGLTLAFLGFVIRFLPTALVPVGSWSPQLLLIYEVVTNVIIRLGLVAIPVTIAFSIMRFRLYDVDLFINRSLVYTAVSGATAAVLLVDIFLFLWLLQLVTGGRQPTFAVMIGTAVAVGAFNPIRKRIQRFVDKNVYGIEIDYDRLRRADMSPPSTDSLKAPKLDTGQTFGTYRVVGSVGRGGMAEVYRGLHPTLNRPVAIKVLSSDLATQADFRARFEREAKTIAQLNHPHIVQVFDFGVEGDTYFMVMEFIEGPTLAQMIRDRGALPYDEVAPVIKHVASALDYAHLQGVVHRDVKPSNVMLRPATDSGGGLWQGVLTDFGIAKIAGGDAITRTGMMG